jgi:predicted 3-demethylubiquinone-9 3-methyltransferase (glyoxalase superfamily)
MPLITPCLWFDGRVPEAISLYTSVFGDVEVLEMSTYPEGAPGPAQPGDVLMAVVRIAGQQVQLLNGGPHYPQTEAFSFSVSCADQQEADRYWYALTADGGQEGQCGWLKDPFGVSWQIVPEQLAGLIGDPDPGRSQRAMTAMLGQRRLDIAAIERAADGDG